MAAVPVDAYQEVVGFIAARPTLDQMAAFRFSELLEARINELLSASHSRRLTDSEAAELDEFDRLEHMMRMIKLTAMEKLANGQS